MLKNWWAFYLKFHKFTLSEASIFPRLIDSNPLHYSISLISCPFAIRTKHQVSCSNDDWSEAAMPWLCTILKWFMHCTPWTHCKLYNSSGTSITQNVMVNSSPELSSLLSSARKLCKIHSKLRCVPERKRSSKQHHQSTIPVVLCGGIYYYVHSMIVFDLWQTEILEWYPSEYQTVHWVHVHCPNSALPWEQHSPLSQEKTWKYNILWIWNLHLLKTTVSTTKADSMHQDYLRRPG